MNEKWFGVSDGRIQNSIQLFTDYLPRAWFRYLEFSAYKAAPCPATCNTQTRVKTVVSVLKDTMRFGGFLAMPLFKVSSEE